MRRFAAIAALVLVSALGGALAYRLFLGPSGQAGAPVGTGMKAPAGDKAPGREEASRERRWDHDAEPGAGPGILPGERDLDALPAVVTLPAGFDRPVARVNGAAITLADIFPPGVVQPDDAMPRELFDRYVQEAVDRQLVIQQARREGLADNPRFSMMVEEMRGDLAAMPNLTPQEQQWRLEYFTQDVLALELYRRHGLMAPKVAPEEVEARYRENSQDYDWLRQRERIKGTAPDKIERRVRNEIERDLALPLKKDFEGRRKAYLAELRRQAEIEEIPPTP